MKLITIIGAGKGISHAVAQKFGKEGFDVALIARSEEKLKQITAELNAQNIEAVYAVADASDADDLQKALFQIRDLKGHAEVILYNAAALSIKDILAQDWQTVKDCIDVSVGGFFHLMKIVLPFALKNNKGKIFVTGGGLAFEGNPEWTSLSVSKAALRNLVQAYQKKVLGTGVHIAQLTVCGYVNPQDEKYSPEKIAEQYWKLYGQQEGAFENEIIY
jgi:short-subunit dehydrogenase